MLHDIPLVRGALQTSLIEQLPAFFGTGQGVLAIGIANDLYLSEIFIFFAWTIIPVRRIIIFFIFFFSFSLPVLLAHCYAAAFDN